MKKLTVLALASLLLAAFSANATAASHRKHTSSVKKTRVIQPVENPVTRLPIPPDTFRA
jgi:hypothetical protein